MYKILIKYNDSHNLWQLYGTTVSSSTTSGAAPTETFTEYETDDVSELKATLLKLDQQFGHDNIRVYKDVTATYSVDITE